MVWTIDAVELAGNHGIAAERQRFAFLPSR
jgi:hypothetical protein